MFRAGVGGLVFEATMDEIECAHVAAGAFPFFFIAL